MRKLVTMIVSTAAALLLTTATVAAGNGPPAVGFYVDGSLYRTIATPTDLSNTGAPAHSFDKIYALGVDSSGDPLLNVAEAAPGDGDYNGGRWMVLPVTWNVAPVQLTSDTQVLAYEALGLLDIATSPAKQFVCPAIPLKP